ncbi:hypothetical protein SmJEL517_g03852 [Synchytrium microbalum]|uniref:tRNA-splicing endonuclease subunit Sen15 domain-containing protein n=1 Tax=Synchytrium microbalum TaxID=1806994 RepID=A0A507C5F3_9FUNG|nr:uncharacterized protein SmJEL517_g03852 [Synchytrium microbalum]TPX33206.1 hypothetical protein SmJEL517_g03852 [Synchytrium microbalum]
MQAHPNFSDIVPQLKGVPAFHQELSFQVYMDLKFGKLYAHMRWATTRAEHVKEWNRVVIWGRMDDKLTLDVMIPTPVSERWSISSLQEYFKVLKHPDDASRPPSSVVLAVVESDSSVSYYRIHSGLVPPPQPKSR